MTETLHAEDVGHYWKTSKTAPDTWIERAKQQITKAGGVILGEGFVSETEGRAAYMLAFRFGETLFKAVWPVLPSKGGDTHAARVQAATMLYHDVKARCVATKVLGARAAFFNWLVLPDGRTTSEAALDELADQVPLMLGGGAAPRLPAP